MRVFWLLVLAKGTTSGVAAAQSPPQPSTSVVPEQHVAAAPPPPSPATYSGWAERPFALDANVGLAMPLGGVGVSIEYAPIRWVSLGAGVGTNLEGPQLAGMLRFRFTPNKQASLLVDVVPLVFYFGAAFGFSL